MKEYTLGLRLLMLRQEHGLTQKQLCERLNISRSAYSYYETGSRVPDVSTLAMIARHYNVTLDSLLGNVDGSPREASDGITDMQLLHHLSARHIPPEKVMELSKADFDLLMDFKGLTEENRQELQYLMKYKLRKQSGRP